MLNRILPMNKIFLVLSILCWMTIPRSIAADKLEPGLVGEYFDLADPVEDFPKIAADKKPTIKRVDKDISFRSTEQTFPGTKLQSHFAIRWTGKIKLPSDGQYTFYLESDDGSRLLIDGKKVLDNGGLHEMQESDETIQLTAGEHDITVDYFENDN